MLTTVEHSHAKLSVYLYGTLIKAASCVKRVKKCKELRHQLVEERGLEPNEVVLGCMMDALVCNKCTTEAVELFRRWRPKLGSNMIMISTLVKGFAAENCTDEAMEMWREMKSEGAKLNAVVYNTLFDAQARAGRTDDVAILFQGMEADGLIPDAIAYSTMVKSHCVKGDMTRALDVLSEMQALGLCKVCRVFNTVLDWFTRHNRMDVADRVLSTLEQLNVAPTNVTVGILVKMYGRRRMLDEAFKVARLLPEKWGFVANAPVFTCLISACFLNKSVTKAIEVFQELRVLGVDAKGYGVLINGCLKVDKVREAVEFVEDAYGLNGQARGLPSWSDLPTDMLEPLLRSLAQRGQSEQVGRPLLASLRGAGAQVDFRVLASACDDSIRQAPFQQQQRPYGRNKRPERNWATARSGALGLQSKPLSP